MTEGDADLRERGRETERHRECEEQVREESWEDVEN